MKMPTYVELNRLFVDYDESHQGENKATSFVDYLYGAKSWAELLKERCTVVIAEAGTGKSEEFRQQTRRLRAEGKPAFFCALDLLAKLPLRSAIGSSTAFDSWLQGSEHGYFFLDAVDEAKLVDPRDFAVAMANFASAVEPVKGRYSLVVSTRPHAWQANTDRILLAERLDLNSATQYAKDNKTLVGIEDPDAVDASEVAATSETKEASPVAVVRLAGLSTNQVKAFAAANDVDYPDSFIDAIEKANAEVFATRPADLPGLIALWKRDGRIGGYSDVVRYNVEIKLQDLNPAYMGRRIALEHAMIGAQALAAAATLSGRTSFLVPDGIISEKVRSNSIDPAKVLQSWSAEEISALLSTALFDESLYGTVRFHHRTAREYLCACWLARLLDKRKNRRKIEDILFAQPYGTEPLVVRPAMKPIAAWLALSDQDIRDQILNADPKVLLEYGDASALDIGTRNSLLKLFAARYRGRNHTPIRMDKREVRRLADGRLSATIALLFAKHRNHVDVRHLLLRVVREGLIPKFDAVAFSYLRDSNVDGWTKILSVQVITTAGTVASKKRLAKAILKKPIAFPRGVVGHAVEALVPDYISYQDFVKILEAIPASVEYSSDQMDLELPRVLAAISDVRTKLSVLAELEGLLARSPLHDAEFARISTRYDWLLDAVGEFACEIASSDSGTWSNSALLSVLSMCQHADHLRRYTGGVLRKSSEIIEKSPELKQSVFWQEVRCQQRLGHGPVVGWWLVSHLPALRVFNLRDFALFLTAIRDSSSADDRKTALSAAFAAWHQSGRSAGILAELKAAVTNDVGLAAELEGLLSPPPPDGATRKARARHEEIERENARERAERANHRLKWIEKLKSDPSQVGDLTIAKEGKLWNTSLWLFDDIRRSDKQNSRWTVTNWQNLIADFGEEIAERFRDFCRRFWREFRPPVRSEYMGGEHSTPNTVIFGLSGVAMDWDGKASWATSLSPEEAELAARYGTWEMNGFPPWFESLHEAHSAVVDKLLVSEARWELTTPTEGSRNYVLSRLRWSSRLLGAHLSGELAGLIQASAKLTDYAVREAIDIILMDSGRPSDAFIDTVRRRSKMESERRALWIAVLLALDGIAGFDALKEWIGEAKDAGERSLRTTTVLSELFNDARSGAAAAHQDFVRVPILASMLAHLYAVPDTDDGTDEDGVTRIRSTDSSASRRDHVLELLFNLPGRETHDALVKLAMENEDRRDHLLALAERRAEQDSEAPGWSASDVYRFAADVEQSPHTEEELFQIALSRLDDLKHEYEQGDESEASLLMKVVNEVELRKVIANRLKLAARSNYTTGSEEELADGKRTDIRIHHPAVANRVPIEIKIAGRWRADELQERLRKQLVGQYMRESRYGVFLLVNRGASSDSRGWRVNGRRVGLPELVEWLQKQANALQRKSSRVGGLRVLSIDLLLLGSKAPVGDSKSAKPKKAVAKRATKKVPQPKRKVDRETRRHDRRGFTR
ncbi:hypothetical protein L6654_41140 [Bradyrhizobium sp. WYCCWR 13023]|uniref:Uncharacterized protein n=1 Tax=Bradyrhizobium zhengyangense TaxID=2911009 RepID=A0A9X1RJ46_9BRAD|nr:hypothetical protein [Bradyrhizobium zhengyangense]MCG2632981.1 hypothetical protein [Bradyrhizobium zhengyangense]